MDNPQLRTLLHSTEEVIELGWNMLAKARKQANVHVSDKELFFSGAGFLFEAVMNAMMPGTEPTEKDLEVCAKIHQEILKFNQHFNLKFRK